MSVHLLLLITKDGLKPDPEKVKAVQEMPRPTSKKELLSLLGFVNYLSKFLPRLSEVAQPLREMTAKEAKFMWSPQHETALKEVRELVVRHPVLKYYDLKEEVTVQCDASEYWLGAALLQNGQPVAIASRSLSQTERQYAQIEKECLAIVFSCERFSQYLAGQVPQFENPDSPNKLHASEIFFRATQCQTANANKFPQCHN